MSDPLEALARLKEESLQELTAVATPEAVEAFHVKWLGRKEGRVSQFLQNLPNIPLEQRREVGRPANELKSSLEAALGEKRRAMEGERLARDLAASAPDLSLPAVRPWTGGLHPISRVMEEITGVFWRLGFNVAEGPEVENDENNFTALNHPPDHPARDAHDTFYLQDYRDDAGRPLLLRTHTSPVQIRYMRGHRPPVYIVAPGRVFRHENVDATHSYVFHQVEGLAIDRGIALADLKGVLQLFAEKLFGPDTRIRFRPSYFPFVEPGIEVDISCRFCKGAGCRICKHTGWVEMLGAGLVHPHVLRSMDLDPDKYSGYAFGIGVERVAMFKYGVDDMRLFYENDLRFLSQFQ